MATVVDRIKQAPACKVIELTSVERETQYTGAGWKLARFEKGVLAGFFDPAEVEFNNNRNVMANDAFEAATAWLANAQGHGEVWLVMCSCGTLCDPRRIELHDAGALAHLGRVIAEQFADFDE